MASIDQMISLIPDWMRMTQSGSLGYQFLSIMGSFLDECKEDQSDSFAGRYIKSARLSTPWLGYRINYPDLQLIRYITITRDSLPGGYTDNPPVDVVLDLHDFFYNKTPVAYLDVGSNTIFFNNLLAIQKDNVSGNVATTPDGYVTYLMGIAIREGTFIRWREGTGDWNIIEPYDGIIYGSGEIRIPDELLDDTSSLIDFQFSYVPSTPTTPDGHTNTYVTLNLATPEQYEVLKHTIWNYFDDLGLLVGVTRLEDEDNYNYRTRILNALLAPGNATYEGLMCSIGRGLTTNAATTPDISTTYEWTGLDTLSLGGQADFVYVRDAKEVDWVHLGEMYEERVVTTTPDAATTKTYRWYTSKPVEDNTAYEIYINDRYAPNYQLITIGSGKSRRSYVDLSSDPERDNIRKVQCTYAFRNYEISATTTPGSYVLTPVSITPRDSNNPYHVTVVNSIIIKRLYDSTFISEELLATTPTARYKRYADFSLSIAPVVVGHARYGKTIWASREAIHPEISHIGSNWDM